MIQMDLEGLSRGAGRRYTTSRKLKLGRRAVSGETRASDHKRGHACLRLHALACSPLYPLSLHI